MEKLTFDSPATVSATPKPTPQFTETNLVKPVFLKKNAPFSFVLLFVVVGLAAGITTGLYFAKAKLSGSGSVALGSAPIESAPTTAADIKVGTVYGNPDEKAFRDPTEGVLQAGGVEGEGTHHLVRPGGKSQNVYLTSSVVDLDTFVGHKIMVWGETVSAKKAGWLMDVGRLKVTELNAPVPTD